MLIKCPECELQVSDKASACPHCGYPMKGSTRRISRSTKRRRLPNGFGRITELKGRNLRKPYRAMVTVGYDENGKPIGKLLKPDAYFATYNEAYMALAEYNKNPYELEDSITVEELYEKWSTEYFKTLKSVSSERTVKSAWKYCSSVYSVRVRDIRARHIKGCMEDGYIVVDGDKRFASPNIKSRIKSLWNLMMDYAVEYELTDRNYARTFEISKDVIKEREDIKRGHLSYTDAEMEILWANINDPIVVTVLIQCYSGWRPQELGLLEIENVDLANGTFSGGMKTEAGTNRVVPIHSKIMPFIKELYDAGRAQGAKYLIVSESGSMTYDKYQHRYTKMRDRLGLNPDHRPHDGRKQFVTMAKKYKVDEYAIKKIVGHATSDITEKIYTDRDANWLKEEIEKIK